MTDSQLHIGIFQFSSPCPNACCVLLAYQFDGIGFFTPDVNRPDVINHLRSRSRTYRVLLSCWLYTFMAQCLGTGSTLRLFLLVPKSTNTNYHSFLRAIRIEIKVTTLTTHLTDLIKKHIRSFHVMLHCVLT